MADALPAEDLAQAAKVQWQWGVKIPLRDGVLLNATVYRPAEQKGPRPCLFTLTPYIGQSYHDRGMYFAAHGYPFLTIDVRGRGNSEGTFRPFIQEAQDGYDVVEQQLAKFALSPVNSCSRTFVQSQYLMYKLFHIFKLNCVPALDGLYHQSSHPAGQIAFLVLVEHFEFSW